MPELYTKDDPWIKAPPEPYTLPYKNAAVQAFVDMANRALTQVRTSEETCRSILNTNENTAVDLLPTFPQLQEPLASSLLSANKSLLLAAESCAQAQRSLCQALASAIDTAQKQGASLNMRVTEVDGELKVDSQYLEQALKAANEYSSETEGLLKRADNEWHQVTSLFGIDEEEARNDLLRSQVLASSVSQPEAEAEPEAEEQAEERPSAWATIWSYTKLIILAFLIAIIIRAYCFDVTVVDGLSMYPALDDGDLLICSKISLLLREPETGEIVVLNAPDSPGDNYIKRVIAGPNDELMIADGRVFVNGQHLTEDYLPDGLLTEGDIHTVIPQGFYFVMGDNREDSRDSRADGVGLISRDAIEGMAVLRLYPFDTFGKLN